MNTADSEGFLECLQKVITMQTVAEFNFPVEICISAKVCEDVSVVADVGSRFSDVKLFPGR